MRKSCSKTPVEFVENVFGEGNPELAEAIRAATGSEDPAILLVADVNVVQRTPGLGSAIGRYLQEHSLRLATSPAVIGGGERIKGDDFQSVRRVLAAALEAKVGHGGCMVALGGGTLLDVAGWVAAQVRGGTPILRVPTTPAAMADAAFATTAAIDTGSVKDAMSVPSVPASVLVDTRFIGTVLDGVWRGGFATTLRYALAKDAALARKVMAAAGAYRERDYATVAELTRQCAAVRAKKGPSSFGLWCAHRLEAMSGYKLPHGYALAIGIAADTAYAQLAGLMDEADRDAVIASLAESGAMEGASHSQHLLTQQDAVMHGLDAWRLATGVRGLELATAFGKSSVTDDVDLPTMKSALNMIK